MPSSSPSRPEPDAQREAVARGAARFLERRLADGMIVAVGHGRDTGEVPRYFRPMRTLDVVFASAMGGFRQSRGHAHTNPNEICSSLADRCGGRAESLYAPAYVESEEMRDRLLEQEAVTHTLSLAARATWRWSASVEPTTVAPWSAAACRSARSPVCAMPVPSATCWATTWTRAERSSSLPTVNV